VTYGTTSGSALPEATRASLREAMRAIIPAMFKAQQPWALVGSTASVLQGLRDYRPPDIDLATTMEGAYIMAGAVGSCGATVRPISFSVAPPYASHFGIFEVGECRVEVMGGLVIRTDDGAIDLAHHWARWSEKVRVVEFEGMHVPVAPLEWQLVANELLRRDERVRTIAACLLERGYDRDFLESLLADETLGERTINGTRRVLGHV
jgi:hypothetical protein